MNRPQEKSALLRRSARWQRSIFACLVFVLLLPVRTAQAQTATAATAFGSEIVTAWADLVLELVRGTPGFSPPVASRAIGYWGLTLYESVAPGMPGYRSLAGELPGLQPLPLSPAGAELHWPVVANSASAAILRRLFANAGPTQMGAITALEQSVIDRFSTTVAKVTLRQSVEQGRAVAAAIYAWSQSDGGHEGYRFNTPSTYKAPVGDAFWAPTPPKYARALQPYWGQNRTFAPELLERCRLPEPPPYSTSPDSDLYREAWTVYTTVRDLRPDQRLIALYWSDDPGTTSTPPGHSLAILTQTLREQQSSLAAAAESYARTGMALSDAFVLAWATKYEYNQLRPITYIQRVIDPAWNRPVVLDPVLTPPFPDYPSGHATECGAAMQVLTDLFGDDYAFVDRSHERLGYVPRAFPSFNAAADEAAVSRLYGGIHYPSSNEQGLVAGRCIAGQIMALEMKE